MLSNRAHKLNAVFIFLSCLLIFIAGLASQEITGFDSRFYLFAQEMQRHGASWFPMTYHQPYPDYPASSTFMIYLCSLIFGSLNKLIAILPTAVMAAGTVAMTYLIGSLHHQHWGYCAAILMLLTNVFFKDARAITLDMYPAMITALCFYLIYSADRENKPRRALWIYPLLLLSFAFRGPIGMVMPAGVICMYYLLNRHLEKFLVSGFVAFFMCCICTSLLLLLAHYVGGDVFMRDVLRMEIAGRMDNAYLPRYFYFTNSLASYALAYPLALLTMVCMISCVRSKNIFFPHKKLLLQLLGWMMVILVGMSIPDDKKVRYILPMMPAVALLAAYPFVASASQRYFAKLRMFIRRMLLIFPFLFLSLTIIIHQKLNLPIEINFKNIFIFLVLMQAISLAAIYFDDIEKREKVFITIAALCFVMANIMIVEPVQLYLDRARDFVAATEQERIQAKAHLVFYRESPDGLAIKYLVNKSLADDPVFLRDEKMLDDFQQPGYFVTSASYYAELSKTVAEKFHVLARNSLGHVPVVVFVRKERAHVS